MVETVIERDNAYMIKFRPYSYPLEIKEIVTARKVVVVTDDGEKELHASDTISKPRFFVHAVKRRAWSSTLDIVLHGFSHGT